MNLKLELRKRSLTVRSVKCDLCKSLSNDVHVLEGEGGPMPDRANFNPGVAKRNGARKNAPMSAIARVARQKTHPKLDKP